MKRIYLDYAATTPICPDVLKAMLFNLEQSQPWMSYLESLPRIVMAKIITVGGD